MPEYDFADDEDQIEPELSEDDLGLSDEQIGDFDSGLLGAADDRETVPIVVKRPTFPQRALKQGISGWIILGLAVSARGLVKDVQVLASSPPNVFDKSATEAARFIKYLPKRIDGTEVSSYMRLAIVYEPNHDSISFRHLEPTFRKINNDDPTVDAPGYSAPFLVFGQQADYPPLAKIIGTEGWCVV